MLELLAAIALVACAVARHKVAVVRTAPHARVVPHGICAAIPRFSAVTLYAPTQQQSLGAAGCLLLYHWLHRQLAHA